MIDVIQKTGPHKVKVIVFSNTSERAAPYIQQAAKQYWDYAVFAMVLWQEQNNTFWETRVGVKSALAVVFVKDPGLEPVIYHGHMNSSIFHQAMEKDKTFELPQLWSVIAAEFGRLWVFKGRQAVLTSLSDNTCLWLDLRICEQFWLVC
jgi:hypothetical protein